VIVPSSTSETFTGTAGRILAALSCFSSFASALGFAPLDADVFSESLLFEHPKKVIDKANNSTALIQDFIFDTSY
jgi:hypothetical protein